VYIVESGRSAQDEFGSNFILTAKAAPLTVRTAQPPEAPSNLGVVATTCNSVQVSWNPPREKGLDIISKLFRNCAKNILHLHDCISMNEINLHL
jgi:hypothetical protein